VVNGLLDIFEKSPLAFLSPHITVACQAAEYLPELFDAVQRHDWAEVLIWQQNIVAAERQADFEKKRLILQLHHDLLLPVSRQDMLSLLSAQDSIANQAKDIAGLVLGRRLIFPPSVCIWLQTYVEQSVLVCQQAAAAVSELEPAMQAVFGRDKLVVFEQMVDRLDQSEQLVDDLQISLRAKLMEVEDACSPVAVMFMYKVIERIGGLADCAHHVGAKLMLLMH